MDQTLRDRIVAAISQAEEMSKNPGAYCYLPEIIKSLRAMLRVSTMSSKDRGRRAGAIGRIVTDNYDFSESQFGTSLLEIADEFAASTG